jgi:hypothetical protein
MTTVDLDDLRVRGFTASEYTDEDLLNAWILIIEIIELLTNRSFEPVNLTLRLDGCGTTEIYLPKEIISITSVSETVLGTLANTTDYVVNYDREDPRIVLLRDVFPKGIQNVTIVGRFGYVDPKSPTEQLPRPLIEVAKRLLPIAFENILEDGDRDIDISVSKRNVSKESTDRWAYTKFNKGGIENQLLEDPIMNAILLKYYKGSDIVFLDFV